MHLITCDHPFFLCELCISCEVSLNFAM
jgi:hypothetical protein